MRIYIFYRKESDGNQYVKYQVIGKNWVAVPTHFFKVLILEREDTSIDLESYVMPNTVIDDSTPLTYFQVYIILKYINKTPFI